MNIIKEWILNRKFVQEETQSSINAFKKFREETYRKAFNDARKDLEETNVFNVEERAKIMAEKMVNDMFSPADLNSVITTKNGLVYIGGQLASDAQLANLKSEAEFIVNTGLWRLIYDTLKELAEKAMFVNGETLADIQKGRSILYTLSTQKKNIDTFLSYIPKR